ncbi:MAG: CYTH domain-containing protein [Gemella sp.]|nr:CYTH domain-containing protein [Gemella sp.]
MVEKEIEFKNLLSEEEYNKIYSYYSLENETLINNSNYYYETIDFSLREVGAALRIRHTDTKSEITLKIKGEKENLEYNAMWEEGFVPDALIQVELPENISSKLVELGILGELVLIQKIQTERKEKVLETGRMVLDKTYFLGNTVDYELEFEVENYEAGKLAFYTLLEELGIEQREALPKIARAFAHKKNK